MENSRLIFARSAQAAGRTGRFEHDYVLDRAEQFDRLNRDAGRRRARPSEGR